MLADADRALGDVPGRQGEHARDGGLRSLRRRRRVVWVEPVDEPGRSRWAGTGAALSIEVCHAIREILSAPSVIEDTLSARARSKLAELRGDEYAWAREGRTTLARDTRRSRARWWTFAGGRANAALSAQLDAVGLPTTSVDDLGIGLRSSPSLEELRTAVAGIDPGAGVPIDRRRIEGVKFSACLPEHVVTGMLAARDRDPRGVEAAVQEPSTLATA